MKEHFWFNLVANEIVLHPLHLGTGALLHNERVVAVREEPTRASRIPADVVSRMKGLHRCRICCYFLCQWLVMSWRDPMEKYLRDSGIDKCNVGVVLVGGSAWFPFVKKLIREFSIGKEPADPSILSRLLPLVQQYMLPFMRSLMIPSSLRKC